MSGRSTKRQRTEEPYFEANVWEHEKQLMWLKLNELQYAQTSLQNYVNVLGNDISNAHCNVNALHERVTFVEKDTKYLKNDNKYIYRTINELKQKKKDDENFFRLPPFQLTLPKPPQQIQLQQEEKPATIVLTEDQNKKLKARLDKIENIDDIIKLASLDQSEINELKNDNKFAILYNAIEPLKELSDMIGLVDIKKEVFKHICYFACKLHAERELRHILILGPSGCGKTELAKILGKLYLKLGFLKSNKFNSYTKSDLVGEYVGQTAPKTQKAIDESIDGVMYVDELYSLGNNGTYRSFDKECIDTITLNLSCKHFLFIGAGYAEDVEELFMKFNKGLGRRLTIRYVIKGYNGTELFQMFSKKLTQEGFTLDDATYVQQIFERNAKTFKYYGGDINELIRMLKDEYAILSIKMTELPPKSITNVIIDTCFTQLKEKREDKKEVFISMYS